MGRQEALGGDVVYPCISSYLAYQFSFISPLKTGELGISVTEVVPGLYSDLMDVSE